MSNNSINSEDSTDRWWLVEQERKIFRSMVAKEGMSSQLRRDLVDTYKWGPRRIMCRRNYTPIYMRKRKMQMILLEGQRGTEGDFVEAFYKLYYFNTGRWREDYPCTTFNQTVVFASKLFQCVCHELQTILPCVHIKEYASKIVRYVLAGRKWEWTLTKVDDCLSIARHEVKAPMETIDYYMVCPRFNCVFY